MLRKLRPDLIVTADHLFSSDGRSTLRGFFDYLTPGLLVDLVGIGAELGVGASAAAAATSAAAEEEPSLDGSVEAATNELLRLIASFDDADSSVGTTFCKKAQIFYGSFASPECARLGLDSRRGQTLPAAEAIAWVRASIFVGQLDGRMRELLLSGEGDGGDYDDGDDGGGEDGEDGVDGF